MLSRSSSLGLETWARRWEGGRGVARGRHRLRNLLAASQIALALVLLVGSGLMVRSFQALRAVHPGFERPEDVLTVRVSIPEAEIEDENAVVRSHEAMIRRISELPGVSSVGGTSSVTMDRWDANDPLYFEGFIPPTNELPAIRRYKWITPGYFSTMQNPVLFGRSLDWRDIHDRRPVGVITENLAREYWEDPAMAIGHRVRSSPGSPWREIVGVVGNVRDDGVSQDAVAVVYWPMAMEDLWGQEGDRVQRSLVYVIRTAGRTPESLVADVREAIWSENPNLPLANLRTLQEILDRSMARTAFALVMLGLAAAAAMVLGAVGIYGVISYSVSQRTREIGVRMALGARRLDVSGMVLRQGVLVTGVGIVVGVGAAFGLTRLMSSLLYGVDSADPLTFALTATGISLAATLIPAHRATAVNPVEALHWD